MRRNALAPIFALVIVIMDSAGDARADIMTTCTSEISRFCSDVNEGEGRIVACLVGQMTRLTPLCLVEVESQGPMTPEAVRMIFNPAFRAALPETCAEPAAQFCSDMTPGEGRVFACLYARSDRLPKDCSDAAQEALKLAR
jgi:hypothetical protein